MSAEAAILTDGTSIGENMSSASDAARRIFSAYLLKISPSGERTVSPWSLWKSLTPSHFSSSAMFWLTAGWLIPSFLAASVKLFSAANAKNTFSLKSSSISLRDFVQN